MGSSRRGLCFPAGAGAQGRAGGWKERVDQVVQGADDFSSIGEVRKTKGRKDGFRGVDGGLSVWSGRPGKSEQPWAWARLGWGTRRPDPGPAAL